MSRVKIGFSKLTVPEQVERSRLIITAMTGNVNYTTPSPALAVMSTATDDLETAYNESRGRDKDKTAIMRLRREELLFLINQLASYVQLTSDGDEEKILSSGFDVRGVNTSHPVTAGPVNNVRLMDGSVSGSVKIDWDEADDAVIYVIVMSLTPEFTDDDFKGCTTKTQKEIGGLNPGTRYWVKVTALGREFPGTSSEAVSILVR